MRTVSAICIFVFVLMTLMAPIHCGIKTHSPSDIASIVTLDVCHMSGFSMTLSGDAVFIHQDACSPQTLQHFGYTQHDNSTLFLSSFISEIEKPPRA